MVAAVKSMMFKGKTPWHGLGNKIEDSKRLSVDEAIIASGLDEEVKVGPVFDDLGAELPAQVTYTERDGKRYVYAVVGPSYKPLQNRKAFEFFQPWLDNNLAEFHTAGALFDGKKIWVLAKLTLDDIDIAKNDPVTPFILLSNSHDGTNAIRVGFTPIRVVCSNTLSMAINSEASKLIRVRHTSKMETNLEALRDTMNLVKQEFEATAEQYRFLASKQFNQADIEKYVKVLIGAEETPNDEMATKTVNIMSNIMSYITDGLGQDNAAIKGTWWAAYNGYNEYLNYAQGRNADNRMDNLWFGQGVAKNSKALQLAFDMAV